MLIQYTIINYGLHSSLIHSLKGNLTISAKEKTIATSVSLLGLAFPLAKLDFYQFKFDDACLKKNQPLLGGELSLTSSCFKFYLNYINLV